MPPDADLQKADLIKKAIAEIRNRLGKKAKKQFAGFLTAYFAQVPPQDILGYSPKMLIGLAAKEPCRDRAHRTTAFRIVGDGNQ